MGALVGYIYHMYFFDICQIFVSHLPYFCVQYLLLMERFDLNPLLPWVHLLATYITFISLLFVKYLSHICHIF